MRYILAVLALVSAAVTSAAQEGERMACGPTLKIDQRLSSEFGESVVAAGVVANGIMYMTTNPESGSFTILLRRPDGMSCILMGGTGLAVTDPAKPAVKGIDL